MCLKNVIVYFRMDNYCVISTFAFMYVKRKKINKLYGANSVFLIIPILLPSPATSFLICYQLPTKKLWTSQRNFHQCLAWIFKICNMFGLNLLTQYHWRINFYVIHVIQVRYLYWTTKLSFIGGCHTLGASSH